MSHFYGSIQGARGEATRTGTKSSGYDSHIRGWNLGVRTRAYHSTGARDTFDVQVSGGSNQPGHYGKGFRPQCGMIVRETDTGIEVTFYAPDGTEHTYCIDESGEVAA